MMRRLGLVAVLVVAGLLAAASPSSAGEADDVTIKVAKRKEGPYSSALVRNMSPGESKNAFAKVKNRGPDPETVDLYGPVNLTDYRIRYFKANGDEITSHLSEGGFHQFSLGAGKAKVFRMKIKAKPGGLAGDACPAPTVVWDSFFEAYALIVLNTTLENCVV